MSKKILTDTERLEIAVSLFDDRQFEIYAGICEKRKAGCPDGFCMNCIETKCIYLNSINPEANGFYNVPVECENRECADCNLDRNYKLKIDCPYVE